MTPLLHLGDSHDGICMGPSTPPEQTSSQLAPRVHIRHMCVHYLPRSAGLASIGVPSAWHPEPLPRSSPCGYSLYSTRARIQRPSHLCGVQGVLLQYGRCHRTRGAVPQPGPADKKEHAGAAWTCHSCSCSMRLAGACAHLRLLRHYIRLLAAHLPGLHLKIGSVCRDVSRRAGGVAMPVALKQVRSHQQGAMACTMTASHAGETRRSL